MQKIIGFRILRFPHTYINRSSSFNRRWYSTTTPPQLHDIVNKSMEAKHFLTTHAYKKSIQSATEALSIVQNMFDKDAQVSNDEFIQQVLSKHYSGILTIRALAHMKMDLNINSDLITQDLERAIQLNPQNDQAFIHYSSFLMTFQKREQALDCIDQAIQIRPNVAQYHLFRVQAYNQLLGDEINESQIAQALKDATFAIESECQLEVAYFWRGYYILKNFQKEYHKKNNLPLDQAVLDLSEAIKYDPEHSESFYYRGIVYSHLNKYQEALDDFETCKTLNPQKEQVANEAIQFIKTMNNNN
jgi:tetratricopeptide (TPR) repeat protein